NPASVPEPASVLVVVAALVGGLGLRYGSGRLFRPSAALLAATAVVGISNLADAQTSVGVGGVPPGITTPDPVEDDQSGTANVFEDAFLDGPNGAQTNIDGELFLLDYNDPDLTGDFAQYAGMGAAQKRIFLDYGTPVTANWFAYAQRSGADPTADRVGTF